MRTPTARARTIGIDHARSLTDGAIAPRLDPLLGAALPRLPSGRQVFHGLPFDLGPAGDTARWVVADRPLRVELGRAGRASHVVVAHFCDTWRDDAGRRPAGLPIGHVVPIGEPLARYTVVDDRGRRTSRLIRRRFEVNDGILGWGSAAFAAVPHLENEVLDWRGPHRRQVAGRYAPIGQSGVLTVMPGTYGGNQVGMTDFVPSASDDALLWLHAIRLGADGDDGDVEGAEAEPVALEIEPLTGGRPGSDLVLAAVTVYAGTRNPLVRTSRFQVVVGRAAADATDVDLDLDVDLGTVIRQRPAGAPPADADRTDAIVGWGHPRVDPAAPGPPERILVDLSLHPDAELRIGQRSVPGGELLVNGPAEAADAVPGMPSVRPVPAAQIPVAVTVTDAAPGAPVAARVRFVAADGRYLPPAGHRDEINPGFFEDTGGDLILGPTAYAYVPDRFTVPLPVGTVEVEAIAGFDRRPARFRVEVDPSTHDLTIPLDRPLDLHRDGWVTSDTHVHFLAPSTALLQAAAEDVDVVNLLAAQWGDLFTNVTDLEWGSMADPSGRRLVIVGTENRQNVLGHLALLGAHRMTTPLASGGPPEGRMAGILDALLADWADRCRAAGGLVVAAHFPLPYAEIAADILTGRIDAVETQALSPGLDDPGVTEWYRFLNLGERLPVVAGTDKMSSEVPVGAVRAYVHLLDDGPLTFDRWAAAVRAGRTFVTSGPILELAVDGHEPGDVIAMNGPGRLPFSIRARAAQPVITTVELVVNGRVVAERSAERATTELRLDDSVEVAAGSWIAARSRSDRHIESVFATSMAAHTSPVYVDLRDRPLVPPPEDAAVVRQVIEGTRTWIRELAAVATPAERARMVTYLDASLARLTERLSPSR
jgi:hypothetical protein